MDNFFDLTSESMASEPVEQMYNNGQQPPLSPSQKRKRKYEEMETEANAPVDINIIPDMEQLEMETHNNNNNQIEIVEPSAKRQKLGSDEPTLSKLLYANNFSDIVFQVQNKQFHAIKAIFAVKSVKFSEMLFPKNASGQQQDVKFIAIQDITPDAFSFIRDFCYDLDIELNLENVVDVLHASKVYEINKLKKMCIDFLQKIDNVEGLLTILKQIANKQSDSVLLEDEVRDFLQNNINLLQTNGSELIESDIFPQLPLTIVCKIIENDNLGVKEEDLWNSISDKQLWIHEPELKKLIRFCLMDISFLFNHVKQSGVLTEGELVSIYEKKLGLAEDCTFNCNERIIVKKRKRRNSPKKKKKAAKEEVNEEIENQEKEEEETAAEVVEETPVTKKRGRSRSKRTKKKVEETPEQESSPPKTRARRGRSKRASRKK